MARCTSTCRISPSGITHCILTRLLTQASLDRMWTVFPLSNGQPNPGHYGFGWFITAQNGHRLIAHPGSAQGFTAQISRYPDDSITVVVLTNISAARARPDYMTAAIAGLADPALLPPRLAAIPDRDPQIASSLGALLDAIASGASTKTMAAPELEDILERSGPLIQRGIAPFWPGTLTLAQRVPEPGAGGALRSEFRVARGLSSILVWFRLNQRGEPDLLQFQPDEAYRTTDI